MESLADEIEKEEFSYQDRLDSIERLRKLGFGDKQIEEALGVIIVSN
jgi:hypothetical protein